MPGELRIIGGDWRGRKLPTLDVPELRPTTDRVRETLFNWLMKDIHGAVCLDAFSGSGALGLEALSRGAHFVNFCDTNHALVKHLQANITKLNCATRCELLCTNFLTTTFTQKFDIIFLDPPFGQDLLPDCLLKARHLLNENGLVYVETEQNFELTTNFNIIKTKRAGKVDYYLLNA